VYKIAERYGHIYPSYIADILQLLMITNLPPRKTS